MGHCRWVGNGHNTCHKLDLHALCLCLQGFNLLEKVVIAIYVGICMNTFEGQPMGGHMLSFAITRKYNAVSHNILQVA